MGKKKRILFSLILCFFLPFLVFLELFGEKTTNFHVFIGFFAALAGLFLWVWMIYDSIKQVKNNKLFVIWTTIIVFTGPFGAILYSLTVFIFRKPQ